MRRGGNDSVQSSRSNSTRLRRVHRVNGSSSTQDGIALTLLDRIAMIADRLARPEMHTYLFPLSFLRLRVPRMALDCFAVACHDEAGMTLWEICLTRRDFNPAATHAEAGRSEPTPGGGQPRDGCVHVLTVTSHCIPPSLLGSASMLRDSELNWLSSNSANPKPYNKPEN